MLTAPEQPSPKILSPGLSSASGCTTIQQSLLPCAKRTKSSSRQRRWRAVATKVGDPAFASTHQPQMPARGAALARNSHNVLFWNGVNTTRKFDLNFESDPDRKTGKYQNSTSSSSSSSGSSLAASVHSFI